jgi:hypothetical protein
MTEAYLGNMHAFQQHACMHSSAYSKSILHCGLSTSWSEHLVLCSLQLAAMQQYSIAPMGHPPLAKWATEHTQRQHNPPVATSTAITIGSNAALEVHIPAPAKIFMVSIV